MKQLFIAVLSFVTATASFSQNIHLSDSVIYIDDKPVALYYKTVNESMPHYDMDIYSLKGNLLVQASVIKFNAPVAEFKPFYYYEIIFKDQQDTAAVYIEDEAFPIVFAKIMAAYKLIGNDKVSKAAVSKFKKTYPGFSLLDAKIKLFKDYLIETRRFDEQVIRDRSKPVTISHDRIIMQDGIKIGIIREEENLIAKDYNYSASQNSMATMINSNTFTHTRVDSKKKLIIYFTNGNKVDFERNYSDGEYSRQKEETGKSLYEISKTPKIVPGSFADQMLKKVCFLIEEYAL